MLVDSYVTVLVKKRAKVLIINQLTNRTFGNTAKKYLSRVKIELNQTLTNKTVTMSEKNRSTEYSTFSWMQKLDIPSIGFHLEAPTYKEITKIIFKMKLSASPCPLDQVSIIVLKKCPYLRTYLWRIISALWTRGDFPTLWKRGITVLAYKNDSNKGPSNFRPLTQQPVLSKVFTSILRNRIYDFSYKNKCIESNLQKGFWDDISGCIEHTETLTHINHARKKQRSLIITLLDLKNALGEVSHDLLLSVLKYQKVLERNLDTWVLRHSGTWALEALEALYLSNSVPTGEKRKIK